MHNQTWKRFRKRGKAGRRLMYMQTIPLKEHQLLMSNLSSLSLHVHSRSDSLWSVTFAFSHPGEGLRTPTNNCSIAPLKAEKALDPIRLRQCWVKAKRELWVILLHTSKYHTIQILCLSRDLTEFGLAIWSSLSPLRDRKPYEQSLCEVSQPFWYSHSATRKEKKRNKLENLDLWKEIIKTLWNQKYEV